MMDRPRLSTVVVHWGRDEDLQALLAVWPHDDDRFELLVVINGESDELPPSRRGLRYLRPPRNLGFAGGVNLGALEARGDMLLVLNPDARPKAGALDHLLRGFEQNPRVAGLAPRLESEDGKAQYAWQLRPLPSLLQVLRQTLFLPGPAGPRREPEAGSPVEQPAAAALALRRAPFERVGGFDEAFFPAWFEDVDFARRLHTAGERLCYWPGAVFTHRLGSSVSELGYGPFLFLYYRNLVRYLRKHHGPAAARTARLLLVTGSLARAAALRLRQPRRAGSRREAAGALGALRVAALSGWRRPESLARAWQSETEKIG